MKDYQGTFVSAEKLGGGAIVGKLIASDDKSNEFLVEQRGGKLYLCKTLYSEVQMFLRW